MDALSPDSAGTFEEYARILSPEKYFQLRALDVGWSYLELESLDVKTDVVDGRLVQCDKQRV